MGGGITLIFSVLMMLFSSYSHAQYSCDSPINVECDIPGISDIHFSDQANTPLWFDFNACNKELILNFYAFDIQNDSSEHIGIDSISVYVNNGNCENPTLIQTFYSNHSLMNLDQGVEYLIKIYPIEDMQGEFNFSINIKSLIVNGCPTICKNLIINGDFEYTTIVPYPLNLVGGNPHSTLNYDAITFFGADKYTITAQVGIHPFTSYPSTGRTNDHTTGSSNFMYIDPPYLPDTILTVWQQDNIPVVATKEYVFSIWVKKLHGNISYWSPSADISIYIDGQQASIIHHVWHIEWQEICVEWTALHTGNISIELVTHDPSSGGHDFGIDDIAFGEKYFNFNFDIITPTKTCEDQDFDISITNIGGTPPYTYRWSNGATSNPITTQINTSTTFSVTVTDANGCTKTSSALIEPIMCCESADQDYTWTQETISLGGTYTDQLIHINGDVILDGEFTFEYCTFELAPYASLILDQGKKLFNNNQFVNCRDTVWKEIKILPCDSNVNFVYSNYILNSMNGIVNESSRPTKIIRNNFWNNYEQSIYISNWQNSSSNLEIRANTFDFNNSTIDPIYPYVGLRPKKGVSLFNNHMNGAFLNIGEGNSFSNLLWGIYSISSDVNVKNNNFTNIGVINTDPIPKAAIYAQGFKTIGTNSLIVGGSTQNTNSFTNCVNGVVVQNNNDCIISYNNFTNNNTGSAIRIQNMNGYSDGVIGFMFNNGLIEYNSINNFGNGIMATTNSPANIQIKYNNITGSTSQSNLSFGIRINGLKVVSENYLISNNTINHITYGIHANNTYLAKIRSNNVNSLQQHTNPNIPGCGIYVVGSDKAEIKDNKVVGIIIPANEHRTIGIHIENATRSNVTCNTLETLGSSFRATQLCNDSRVFNNFFENALRGITLRFNGNIGIQGSISEPSDNEWLPSLADWTSGRFPHYTYGSNGSACTLFVRQGPRTGINYYSPATDGINNATAFAVTNNANGPAYGCIGQIIIPTDPIDLNMAKALIDEQLSQPVYEEETFERAKSEYLHILPEDSLAMTDIDIQNFISNMYNEPKGILADVHQLIEQKEYIAARNLNNSFQALTIIEETEQTARSIQINLLKNDSISNNEVIILEQLAELCPFTHGQGVYIARALYTLIDPLYEFVNICETDPNFAPKKKQITEKEQQILIYPNPASDIVNFELKNIEIEGKAIVQISDVNGRIVLNKTTEIKLINTLDVSNLTNGCYSLKIILSTGQTFNEKICLTK